MSDNFSARLTFYLGLTLGLLALSTRAPAQSDAAAPTPTPPLRWQSYRMQLPDGVSIAPYNFEAISTSGVIAAIGNAGTGDNHALLLVPITYTELFPASGFDGLTQPHWLMVPPYGNNSASATTPASATLPVSFAVKPDSAVDSVSPATTGASPQTITVHGETLGDSHRVALGVGTKIGTGGGLNVSIKRLKTVTVALHVITLQKGDTYGPTPNALTAQQAQDYLNQIFGKYIFDSPID